MYEFLISTAIVALAEMGDKTQLLALLLAARFRKPLPILLAILAATLINHGLSAALGQWITTILSPEILRWILALGFIGMAIWMLIPDQLDDENESINKWQKYGVFGATFILFFLAEIGDKTQVATVLLAATYPETWQVILGTTIGMLAANVPVVYAGSWLLERISLDWARRVACAIFMLLGVVTILMY